MNTKMYVIIGVVLLAIAAALVVVLSDPSKDASGVAVPQPSGDDAALKNLRVQ